MEKTNSKILTVSYAVAAALIGLTVHLLITAFAGAFGVVARMSDSDMVRHGFPVALGFAVFAVLQSIRKSMLGPKKLSLRSARLFGLLARIQRQ